MSLYCHPDKSENRIVRKSRPKYIPKYFKK
jgi:hypothetical protein